MNYKKIEFDCIINIDENKIIFSKLLGSSLLRLGKIERDIMKLINKQCDINSKGLNNDNLISGELVFEETENQSNRIKHKQEQQEGYKASPKKNSLYNQKQKNDEENSINVGVFGYNFKYNPKTKTIIMPDGDGVGDGASIDYYTKIIGNKVSGNKLEITNKVMFLVCTPVDDFCYISKTTQDINNIKNTLTTINNSDLKNINIDDYLDKLDSYKWTFVKNKAGNYVFESVEKLK